MFRPLSKLFRPSVPRMQSHNPLIAIIGATGTGKSQLAVELAKRFNGEIINGDAMQMYAGLPIITNKITPEEMQGIPHHLLGCVDLDKEPWRVGTFTQKALGVIKEIRSRGRLPILVGGTHYYTQSLIFEESLVTDPIHEDDLTGGDSAPQSTESLNAKFPILNDTTEAILARLKEVDPIMASRWHPNDRRKLRRSLEIYLTTGRTASETYEEQRKQRSQLSDPSHGSQNKDETQLRGSTCDDAPLPISQNDAANANPPTRTRFPTLLLWVHASPDNLRPRLDRRVDEMLARGLLPEIRLLHNVLRTSSLAGKAFDQTRGIWVSIGHKEFGAYLSAVDTAPPSPTPEQQKHLNATKDAAVEQTKTATRRYAKSQTRWIRIKLLNALRAQWPPPSSHLYLLDGSDLAAWTTLVTEPASALARAFLAGEPLPAPEAVCGPALAGEMLVPKREFDVSGRRDQWVRRVCEACGGMTTVVEQDWERHVKSRGHRRAVRGGGEESGDRGLYAKNGGGRRCNRVELRTIAWCLGPG